jgi:hypothetical protein
MSNVTRLAPFPEMAHVMADIPISERDEFERAIVDIIAGERPRMDALDRDLAAIKIWAMAGLQTIEKGTNDHPTTGGAKRLVRFLAGLYNGQDCPFDLTKLRGLDIHLANACLDYLNYDRLGAREYGNTVFVNNNLISYQDQWAFLASLSRLTPRSVYDLISEAEARDRVISVRMPVADDSGDEPWRQSPSRKRSPERVTELLPAGVKIVLSDDIYIDRTALPSSMVARLTRLAAFQNPEFYRAQAMRLPTFGKPRIISCASLHKNHVALPRGCLEEALELLGSHDVETDVEDLRESGASLDCRFLGTLRDEQQIAVDALSTHDCGVLAATTAFGKTVVAAALIAHRRVSTLVLVHRKELLKQWAERLRQFLSVDTDDIGVIGGGRRKPTGRIDVALIQSLFRRGEASDQIAGYGHLIVDECHHLSVSSFELVARRSKSRYVLGLSATVTRKDGHHPIIFMQCGPVRHRVDPKSQAMRRGFHHKALIRDTVF